MAKMNMKAFSSVTLTCQTTVLVLLLRYSRTIEGPTYFATTAVFLAEVLKVCICLVLVTYTQRHNNPASYIYHSLFDEPMDTFKLAIPAALYAVQNNLLYVALTHLPPATYQITYQLKILTTALFSVVMLGRSLSLRQIGALLVLMSGVVVVQLEISGQKSHYDDVEITALDATATEEALEVVAEVVEDIVQKPLLGLFAVLAACMSSGFAGVYFEKIMKGTTATIPVRNIQLGTFGAMFSLLLLYFNDGDAVMEKGFLYGYSGITWVVVCNQATSGLVVAVVVVYADSIIKTFTSAVSIVLSSILSAIFFGFKITLPFTFGGCLVCGAVVMYGTKLTLWDFAELVIGKAVDQNVELKAVNVAENDEEEELEK